MNYHSFHILNAYLFLIDNISAFGISESIQENFLVPEEHVVHSIGDVVWLVSRYKLFYNFDLNMRYLLIFIFDIYSEPLSGSKGYLVSHC